MPLVGRRGQRALCHLLDGEYHDFTKERNLKHLDLQRTDEEKLDAAQKKVSSKRATKGITKEKLDVDRENMQKKCEREAWRHKKGTEDDIRGIRKSRKDDYEHMKGATESLSDRRKRDETQGEKGQWREKYRFG